MEFIDDEDYAFFLGDDILFGQSPARIGPSLSAPDEPGTLGQSFRLNKDSRAGTTITWEVPLDTYPVFVREGARWRRRSKISLSGSKRPGGGETE